MPVEFPYKTSDLHAITELEYELVTDVFDIAGRKLKLTTLANVEKAIDLVFSWLDDKGRDPVEIERLAPYFGVIWPSALALCGYLLQDQICSQLAGKSVIELGCGLAIPSILAAKSGAICTATDHHPDVPRFLMKNIESNEPCSLRFISLAHENISTFAELNAEAFDWVIASDVLYEKHLVEVIADDVTKYAKPTAKCIIADPGRPYIQEFVNAMQRRGWNDYLEPWTVPHQGVQKDIFLMIFDRK